MLKNIILALSLLLSSSYSTTRESIKDSNNTIKVKTLSGKKLVIFVNSANLQKAGMGLGIALSGAKQGASVTIVLGADAIKYALKDGEQNIYFAKERTPRRLLQDAIKSGASVQLCSANTEIMGLDEDDFILGTKIIISTDIFAKVFEDGVRVISF